MLAAPMQRIDRRVAAPVSCRRTVTATVAATAVTSLSTARLGRDLAQ